VRRWCAGLALAAALSVGAEARAAALNDIVDGTVNPFSPFLFLGVGAAFEYAGAEGAAAPGAGGSGNYFFPSSSFPSGLAFPTYVSAGGAFTSGPTTSPQATLSVGAGSVVGEGAASQATLSSVNAKDGVHGSIQMTYSTAGGGSMSFSGSLQTSAEALFATPDGSSTPLAASAGGSVQAYFDFFAAQAGTIYLDLTVGGDAFDSSEVSFSRLDATSQWETVQTGAAVSGTYAFNVDAAGERYLISIMGSHVVPHGTDPTTTFGFIMYGSDGGEVPEPASTALAVFGTLAMAARLGRRD